jgi:hypothetical protein
MAGLYPWQTWTARSRVEVMQQVSQEAVVRSRRMSVSQDGRLVSDNAEEEFVSRLAQFFPGASPVRVPVQVTGGEIGGVSLTENTVIEYGTPNEVLFASSLPLEFADQLRLRNADGSLDTDVYVVALQYQSGRTAVAARFAHDVANWIVK